MKTLTEMAIDYLDTIKAKEHKKEVARMMIDELEQIYFKKTCAFDTLEIDANNAIDYLQYEIKELSKND